MAYLLKRCLKLRFWWTLILLCGYNMTIIRQEKTIERVPLGTLKPTDCFYLSNTGGRVWMYVESRVNGNGSDDVFAIDIVTGVTQEIPGRTLVEEAEAAMIVKG